MKLFSTGLIALGLISLMGCSNHNRTSDSLLTAPDVEGVLQDLETAQAASAGGADMASALALKDQEGAFVYLAYGPTPTMTIHNVVSFLSFTELGFPTITTLEDVNRITDARVVVIDTPNHDVALIIGLKMGDADYTYSVFTGSGSISDGAFTAQLTGDLVIKTFDLADGDLGDVIQIRIYKNGDYLGKVPTLTGFAL